MIDLHAAKETKDCTETSERVFCVKFLSFHQNDVPCLKQ